MLTLPSQNFDNIENAMYRLIYRFQSEFLISGDYKLVTFDQFEFLKTFSTSTLAQISYVMNFIWMWNLIFEVFFPWQLRWFSL